MDKFVSDITRIIENHKPRAKGNFVIGITGPGGCGKTFLANSLSEVFEKCLVISTDDYRLSRVSREKEKLLGSNPKANKIDLLLSHLELAKNNKEFTKPLYNSITGKDNSTEKSCPQVINNFEGEILSYSEISKKIDLLIYLKASPFRIFLNRLSRDKKKRKYPLIKAIMVFYKSYFRDYPELSKGIQERANIIIKNKGNREYYIEEIK